MSSTTVAKPAVDAPAQGLFVLTVFASAALVFLVEPMVAKLVLPSLGGSPSVWNTSLAFFQAALLAGYAYAHLLQRLPSARTQALVHLAALLAAGLVLPLRIHAGLGPPSLDHPILWLLGVLTLSLGAPFAVLAATAPLVQAWRARAGGAGQGEPYRLYAASNLGSLLALLAYPAVMEPALALSAQRLVWTAGYAAFGSLIAALALAIVRGPASVADPGRAVVAGGAPWRVRLTWVALAAIPSSLMLGVTTYVTTDVASAPFLWVIPLGLYLLSFVVAFQARPALSPGVTLTLQAAFAAAAAAMLPFITVPLPLQFMTQLAAFFLTALMCAQALVARRPPPEQLTDFYLWISVGGVVGGAFNAFLAPVIFSDVWEYPIVLVLAALVRPQGRGRPSAESWVMLGLAIVAALTPMVAGAFRSRLPAGGVIGDLDVSELLTLALFTASAIAAFRVRREGLFFCTALAALSLGAQAASDRATTTHSWRSFFGVLRESQAYARGLGGPVRLLAHGTTLHGAQALDPAYRCRPLVYYTPLTPIGQVFRALQAERPALRMGVVGLGAGSAAAYVRPADRMTFFEIDPLVVRIATDPQRFTYTSRCAQGPVDVVLGDARLKLESQPRGIFDVLLIDAFSSDAVPTHLLTTEAVRDYLTHLKPDGVLILHLSNRNLDLTGPAQAVAQTAGGSGLIQLHRVAPGHGAGWESAEDAVIIGRSPQALAPFAADPRWRPVDPTQARPWTDDYVNVPGALWRRLAQRWSR